MKISFIICLLIISVGSFGQTAETIEPCKTIDIIKIEIETKKHDKNVITQNNDEIVLSNDYIKIFFYLDSTSTLNSNIHYKIEGYDETWIDGKSSSIISYNLKEFKRGYYTFMIREYNCTGDLKINYIRLVNKK